MCNTRVIHNCITYTITSTTINSSNNKQHLLPPSTTVVNSEYNNFKCKTNEDFLNVFIKFYISFCSSFFYSLPYKILVDGWLVVLVKYEHAISIAFLATPEFVSSLLYALIHFQDCLEKKCHFYLLHCHVCNWCGFVGVCNIPQLIRADQRCWCTT